MSDGTVPFEEFRAEMAGVLGRLGADDMTGFRRATDEMIAQHVDAGWPRAMAGAMALAGMISALEERPDMLMLKLSEATDAIRTGKRIETPITTKIAIAILADSIAPDPEWSHGSGR